MLEKITYRKIYKANGDFSHVELVQGNNVISLSLAYEGIDVQKDAPKWGNIKRFIESMIGDLGDGSVEATRKLLGTDG